MTDQESTKRITLYYAEWCGHCKTFKPEWYKFKLAYNKAKKEIKDNYGIELVINEYESEKDTDIVTKANVDGFPTVKILHNGKSDDYIGPRTAAGLFKKLIPNVKEQDVKDWLDRIEGSGEVLHGEVSLTSEGNIGSITSISIQFGGAGIRNYGIRATDPKAVFANSYRKYLKYKKKCNNLGIV